MSDYNMYIPFLAWDKLDRFLKERGVDKDLLNFDSGMYGKYCKLMFNIIIEGIKAIEEFEAFDRAMSEVD